MKNLVTATVAVFIAAQGFAQVGIGTTTPNSTLDVRGALSLAYRQFTAGTSITSTDNTIVFTGNSAATATLPDATTCAGRMYRIKNASTSGVTPVLTVATTSSQTIDGSATWALDEQNEAVTVVSNGTNWYITNQSTSGTSANSWLLGGNGVSSVRNFGTTTNYDLPFITNNTEKMRLTSAGRLGLGSTAFDGTNPEKLLVDAGTTTSFNVISGKGTINNYLQLNIQNKSNGTSASSDLVATSDNGNENGNYVDLGINSSAYNNSSLPILNGANNGYLYSAGNDFIIGNGTPNKSLVYFTGGYNASNERMRIDGNGNVGIGGLTTLPKANIGAAKFSIEGTNASASGPHVQFTTSSDNYPLMQFMPWSHDNVYIPFDAYFDGGGWRSGTTTGGNFVLAKESGKFLWYYGTVNTQGSSITWNPGVALNNAGKVAMGTSTWDATNPEKLLVDAGFTTSYNVISGKGDINNYLQLNIQNRNGGNTASSDVVATANNGTETANFIDMGINSNGYSSSVGILGGPNNAYMYSTGADLVIGNASANEDVIFFSGGSATTNERMRILSGGNVGIGVTNPADKLSVAGIISPSADNTYTLGKNGARWSAVWSANGTIQTSDARLKTDIKPLKYGLAEVLKMQPVHYKWKSDASSSKVGLIAQDVKRLVPEIVTGDETRENLGMNYAELVPVLINAIKDLQQQVTDLKKEVEVLKRK